MKTLLSFLFLFLFAYTTANAQGVVQNFDNAVGTFFPDPPMWNETFFASSPTAEFNLSNYSADSYDGSGSMKIDYRVESVDPWGGWIVRTTYNVFDYGNSLTYIDLSVGGYLTLWYKILTPINSTQAGVAFFEFKMAEFDDYGQRELWWHITPLNLSDASGDWQNITIPLRKDVDIFNGFILQSDLGYVDGELQLDKIKGFEIAISYYLESEPIDIPTATGTLLLDNLQIWGSYDIYSIDVNTGKVNRITKITDADEYNPSFSNDGKHIAHDVLGGTAPLGHSIYITDVKSGVSKFLEGADGGNDASWSPDGKYITFDRSVVGDPNIYVVPAGGGVRTLVRANAVDAEWSNNSKRLVFTDFTDYTLRTVDLNGGSETELGVQGVNPSWSNDGKYIVYSDYLSLYTIAVNEFGLPIGSPMQLTFDGYDVYNQQPSWSNNGKTIVFHSNRETDNYDFNVWTISACGGTPNLLTGLTDIGDYDPCYSKNGQYVAYDGYTFAEFSISQDKINNGSLISSIYKSIPDEFILDQNYPNPFNPSTKITFSIPDASHVNLTIFDLLGEQVATLVDESKAAGMYSVQFDASNIPSGIYIYRISAGSFIQTKKMILLK